MDHRSGRVKLAAVLASFLIFLPLAQAEGAPYNYATGGWACVWYPGACDHREDANTGSFSVVASNTVWHTTNFAYSDIGHWINVPSNASEIDAEADVILSDMSAVTTPGLARAYVTVQLIIKSPTCHEAFSNTCLTSVSDTVVPFDTNVAPAAAPQIVHVHAQLQAPATGFPQRYDHAQDGEVHVRIAAWGETLMLGSATVHASGVVTDVNVAVS